MPLIMDDSNFDKFDDMDDLFLDPQPVLLATPMLTKDFVLRIDELSCRSCCRSVILRTFLIASLQ